MLAKVVVPVVLFSMLSPGVIFELPGDKIASMKTSPLAVFFHAHVFILVYWLIAKVMGLQLTKADLIVPAILFALMSPWSGEVDLSEVLARSLLFGVFFAILRRKFPQYY